MTILLHNMSAPPRSEIVKQIEQLDDYLCFSPENFAKQLNCSVKNLPNTIRTYIANNLNWQLQTKRPSSYMIAITRKKITETFSGKTCKDIPLQLYIFGGVVGDMYIPNRILNWTKDTFTRNYCFLKKEVLE